MGKSGGSRVTVVHDFATSKNSDDAPWWADVYRRAFPDYERHDVITDVTQQKAGIDHRVHMRGGGCTLVDVKVREKFYEDIALEVWSDVERRSPGWVIKPLQCHYIAYAFPSVSLCYLLPFQLLRLAYERNKLAWAEAAKAESDGFRIANAQNRNYVTRSVVVPTTYLRDALADSMRVYSIDNAQPFEEAS